jgi:hypothetical protein
VGLAAERDASAGASARSGGSAGASTGRISPGNHVYTSDYVDLGTIKDYDSLTGWMLVGKDFPPSSHDLMVPLAAVARVDDVTHVVRLVTSQADLLRMQDLEAVDVVFADV